MRCSSLLLRAGLTLTLTAGGLGVAGLAAANPGGTGLVISEVYGAGGNSGAVYNADFVELYNPTSAAISLVGDYVHYRSGSGTSGGAPFALTGSVPAGGHYLIQMGSAGGTGVALPTPDAGPAGFSMAAAGGQVYLLSTSTAITSTGDQAGAAGVIDMVGAAGSTSFEKAPTTGSASATQSLNRAANGADTDNNQADLSLAAPKPQAGGTTTPPTTSDHTIAEIQGTDTATSSYLGQSVRTTGVVTAAYPSGGFFGYVLQTDGTGTGADATPGASDAVFVHQPSGAVTVQRGQYLQVTGTVSEFGGLTELNVAASDVKDLGTPPKGGVTPLATAYPATDAAREAHESELLAPTDDFTVTDNYSTNQYGEIGLATGDHTLVQPTDRYPASDTSDIDALQAENYARRVTLDDGASASFLNSSTPMSWLTPDNPVRIGSAATLHQPVILDYRNQLWKFQPTATVHGEGTDVATFSDTRTGNAQPRAVGGDLKLATFNVLNYFNTTGKDWEKAGHTCTYYDDRDGDHVTDKECSENGPRGAAESLEHQGTGGSDLTDPLADVERQRAKEVRAINTMGADIVSLEEIENSVALGETDRDDALKSLVSALNADAARPHPWAFVPSPDPSQLPPTSEQDVIRTAFIYNPDKVSLVGSSIVLKDQSQTGQPFANAREPLAQEFKRKGALDSDGFLVIVNHLKSKGDSTPPATGDNANGIQGAFNGDRVRQADALIDFAKQVSTARGTDKVFLVGDFNSYTQEDPLQELYRAGYANQASDDGDATYEFGGLTGSLDHVLANPAARAMVSGRDVWQINAEESVGFEYSRYNYNQTLLYQPNQFRASDHNPELVGLKAPYTQQTSRLRVSADPDRIQKKKDQSTITATVTGSSGSTPTGPVTFLLDGRPIGTVPLSDDGTASTTVGPFPRAGFHVVIAVYAGDAATRPSIGVTFLTVTNGNPK